MWLLGPLSMAIGCALYHYYNQWDLGTSKTFGELWVVTLVVLVEEAAVEVCPAAAQRQLCRHRHKRAHTDKRARFEA